MIGILVVAALTWVAPKPVPVDTPPALPIPAERLSELKTREDIIGASRLTDGSRPPERLVLPQMSNSAAVLAYMLENYPPALRERADFEMPWGWLLVNELGAPEQVTIVKSSGKADFDSLSVNALRRARFKPALLDGRAVGVWTPMPIEASYQGLAARAQKPPTPPSGEGPIFTPYTVKPQLLNRPDVSRALVMSYPPALREKGIGGTVLLWARIDTAGNVTRTQMKNSSGYPELDRAAEMVAGVMKFTPARNYDQVVAVWIQLPIMYKAR